MPRLKSLLDDLRSRYHADYLHDPQGPGDPVLVPRRFLGSPPDAEIAALIAACLAYGPVRLLRRAAEAILEACDGSPHRFILNFDRGRDAGRFAGFIYRFHRSQDVVNLLSRIRDALDRHGSLKALFLSGYDPSETGIREALARFADWMRGPAAGRGHFFPDPRAGGPCKRLNLFLRWMVRPDDGIDLGLWPEIRPARLIIPLDTHVIRAARLLRLTRRSSPSWRMAEEITAQLRRLDPEDPLRYDFALCHRGISQQSIGIFHKLS